jgi:hypothetical protein
VLLQAAATLSVGPATGQPGTQIALPIQLNTSLPATALQVDILMDPAWFRPESADAVSLVSHVAATAKLAEGRWRMLLYSPASTALTNGVVALMKINVPATAPLGSLTLTPTNAVLVHPQGTSVQPLTLVSGQVHVSLAAPARWTLVRREPDGQVTLTAEATTGQAYEIQASTNLLAWTTLATVTAANHAIQFVDISAAPLAFRYYRAQSVP